MSELVTLSDLKNFLNIPIADTSEDAKLMTFKNAIEQTIKNFCETDFDIKTVNELLDGLNCDTIVPKHSPIQDVLEITVGVNTDGTGGYSLQASDFYFDENMIFLRSSYTPQGRGRVMVRYRYGYQTVPADVKLAVMQSVKAELQRYSRNSEDISSRSKQGESESFGSAWDHTTGLPAQIISKLEHYRRLEFPVIGFAQRNI